MASIVSVHAFRGGTGKSNTTANLAALIAAGTFVRMAREVGAREGRLRARASDLRRVVEGSETPSE